MCNKRHIHSHSYQSKPKNGNYKCQSKRLAVIKSHSHTIALSITSTIAQFLVSEWNEDTKADRDRPRF